MTLPSTEQVIKEEQINKSGAYVAGLLFVSVGLVLRYPVERYLAEGGAITSGNANLALNLCRWTLLFFGLCFFVTAQRRRWYARFKHSLTRLGLALIGCLCSLVFVEVAIRAICPVPFRLPEGQRLVRYSESLGHEYIPGRTARHIIQFESETVITINSRGMRNPEVSLEKPDGVIRVAVLGDSFTANTAVPQEDVVTEVMNRALGAGWDVLNFGVDAYSTVQEFLVLKEKLLDFAPDVVVLMFYLRNDLIHNKTEPSLVDYAPLAKFDDFGKLVIYNQPVPMPEQESMTQREETSLFRITDLHTYNMLRRRYLFRDVLYANAYPEIAYFNKEANRGIQKQYEIFTCLLREMKTICDEHEIRFVVVNVPSILEVYEDTYWQPIKAQRKLGDSYSPSWPREKLAGIAQKLNLDYIDLQPPLKEEGGKGALLYYQVYQHWNKLGNKVAGEELARQLLEMSTN